MTKESSRTSRFVLPVTMAVGLPAIIIGEKLALGDGLPTQAMAAMFVAYAMSLVWGGLITAYSTEAEARATARADARAEAVAREHLSALELLYTVPYAVPAATVRVTGGAGACPWGVEVGDGLEIEAGGRLSSPLCRTAVMALGPVLGQPVEGRDTSVSCRCPLADRHRTFLAQTTGVVSPN